MCFHIRRENYLLIDNLNDLVLHLAEEIDYALEKGENEKEKLKMLKNKLIEIIDKVEGEKPSLKNVNRNT